MDKLRKWFNKPRKEVENQLWDQPLTSERSHDSRHDDTAPQRTVAPRVDLRGILQEDLGQGQEVSFDQTFCRPLQTTDPQGPAAPPVCSSQAQVNNWTGEPRFRMTDSSSLPSSPHPGGRRLPCSLPCSPLLRGRHWRSSSSSSSISSSLSRLWVEEALQRSKNLRQNEPRPHLPYFTRGRPEGERVTTAEEGEQDRWEAYKQVKAENAVGIRPPDTVTSPSVEESEEEEEGEEDEDLQNPCLDLQTYCQLTPCVCNRCPSAPPFEAELVSDLQAFPLLSHTLTHPSQRTDIQEPEGGSEQSVPRDRAPQLGMSSCLYPSLQNRKQEVDFICSQLDYKPSCYHGDNTGNKLMWLSAGEPPTFCCEDLRLIPKMVIDCSTCIQRTVFSVECCSFCSNKL